jgi:hypothetical protein
MLTPCCVARSKRAQHRKILCGAVSGEMICTVGSSCKTPPATPRAAVSGNILNIERKTRYNVPNQPSCLAPSNPGQTMLSHCPERTQRSCVLVRINGGQHRAVCDAKQRRTWQDHEYPRNPSLEQAIVPTESGPYDSRRLFRLVSAPWDRHIPSALVKEWGWPSIEL